MTPRRLLSPWVWFFILLAALGALVFWLASGSGSLPDDSATGARIVYGVVLAALIGAGLLHGRRMGFKGALGAAFAWLAIGAALVLVYSYRFEAETLWNRLRAELVPGAVMVAGEQMISLRRAADGHFYMQTEINGAPVRFLVDTGASSTVLDPRDAERAGIDVRSLNFTQSFRTANGIVRGAPIRIRRMNLGPVTLADVRASVNEVPLGTSLLGISTLSRFRNWNVAGDTLTLNY